MYIHDEIIEAIKALAEKHDIPKVDMVAEMNHAAWVLLECGKIDQWPVTPNVFELSDTPKGRKPGAKRAVFALT